MKNLNTKPKYIYSILTVNTNHYEILHEVMNPNPLVEYVCVTDDETLTSETWKIIYRKDIWFLYVKHHQYEFISTDICLWLDGSYQITNDPTEDFVMPFIRSNKELMISIHDTRTNVFDELCQWWITRNVSDANVKKLASLLCVNDMSGHDTLFQTSCMLSKNTKNVMLLFENVINVEEACSVDSPYRDDQVIISMCIDKVFPKDKIVLMDFSATCNNQFFHWCFHHSNDVYAIDSHTNRCFNESQHLYRIGEYFS